MAEMDEDLQWTVDNIVFLKYNTYLQLPLGAISMLISIVLFYVVTKSTPEELVARRVHIITQLIGCIIHSVVYSFAQTIPLYPHRALISTGPLRRIEMFPSTIIFIVWISNLTFMANSALSSSVSHYLDTMDGMRQSNRFLNWYSELSFRTKAFISICTHTFIILLMAITIIISIEWKGVYDDEFVLFLQENFAFVRMKGSSVSLIVLGSSFTIFFVLYSAQLFFLNKGVWQQLEEIKPSISPRTWEILHHTSRLFRAIAIQPLFSFFIPTCSYILFQFAFTNVIDKSALILNIITWSTIGLYTLSPFVFYILTLISFKVYRHNFFQILRSPITFLMSQRPRRVAAAEKNIEEP